MLGLEVVVGAGAYLFLAKMFIPETAALWTAAFMRKKV